MSEVDFLIGRTVKELRYPVNGLRIVFDAGDRVEPALYADVAQYLSYIDASGTLTSVDIKEPSSLGAVLGIAGETVEAVSTDDAVLSLVFADGSSLRCEPHPDYEAWQVVGGTPQCLVVCAGPEDGLAVWEVDTPAIEFTPDDLPSAS
jgi:hypothetical protein